MNREFNPSPFAVARLGYRPVFHSADVLGPVRGIAETTRCWSTGGIIGSDKTQTSTDQQTGASDDARGASGNNSLIAQDQGNAQGGIGNLNLGTNSFNAAGANLGGVTGTTNTGTISFGLGAQDVTNLLSDTTTKIGDLVNKQTDAATNEITSTLASLSDLALSKQTGGESARDNTILWIIGVIAAALVAVLVWKK